MSLQYRAEYQLGSHRSQICRTYSGFPALVAISVDLAMGLIFACSGLAIKAAWCMILLAWQLFLISLKLFIELLRLPLQVAREVFQGLDSAQARRRSARKPAMIWLDEV